MTKNSIDKKLLARMQKDLTGFTEKYQKELDNMVGDVLKDLGPIWQGVQNRLLNAVTGLYNDMGKTQDPQKLNSLQYRIDNLINLQLQIAEMQQQQYFSCKIKYNYEKSYYMHSFGLEQAAKVSVNVPLLTQNHLLSYLVNPWLGDGANYSDRLRTSTANLAAKMRETIRDGIEQGWGTNKTALKIRERAGEGLFNAVRLARTEYTRAAAQGANYSYMENADILDEKRWNATLDKKTAKKDAKNDGKTYDLDYDTIENPGIPGQRIPNHPNCRCRWSPVLSALGVSDKQRIARDKDGNRIYTKARTYDEYAKERGLPTSDDMKDNPKAYLRPGESVADLEKRIVRYKADGKEIIINKPDWGKMQQKTTKDELAAGLANIPKHLQGSFDKDGKFNYDRYFIEVRKLKDKGAVYNYTMDMTDHLLKPLIKDASVEKAAAIKYVDSNGTYKMIKDNGVEVHIEEEQLKYIKEYNDAKTLAEQRSVYDRLVSWFNKLKMPQDVIPTTKLKSEMSQALQAAKAEAYADAFKDFELTKHDLLESEKVLLNIDPQGSIRAAKLKTAISKANDWLATYVHPQNVPLTGIKLERLSKGARAYAYSSKGIVCLPTDTSATTAVHEAGHCIHGQNERTRQLVTTWFEKRTEGLPLETIYKGTSEKGYKDSFIDHYIGKVYSWEKADQKGQEVVSMGMQYMYEDPKNFYIKDPKHFKLIYAILRGLQ